MFLTNQPIPQVLSSRIRRWLHRYFYFTDVYIYIYMYDQKLNKTCENIKKKEKKNNLITIIRSIINILKLFY